MDQKSVEGSLRLLQDLFDLELVEHLLLLAVASLLAAVFLAVSSALFFLFLF